MGGFTTISGVNRELSDGWVSIGGVWRKLNSGWVTKDGAWQQIYSSGLPTSNIPVGTMIKINENGVGVNYRVVHQGLPSSLYDNSCSGTWVMRETLHSKRVWDSTDNDYKNSDIHTYLNGTFLGLFDSATQATIKQAIIPYHMGTGDGGLTVSGSSGLSTKIFLLSCYEVGWTTDYKENIPVDGTCLSYFSGTATTDTKRIAYYDGTATYWWLRSPVTTSGKNPFFVNTSGGNGGQTCTRSNGIRPAMVLNGNVNPTPNADGSYTLLV